MMLILTGNKRQKKIYVIRLRIRLSAGVLTDILACGLLYNQRTVVCDIQSAGFTFGIFTNLPTFNQLHWWCVYGVSKEPVNIVTFALIISTRQSDFFSIPDKDVEGLSSHCCWKDERGKWIVSWIKDIWMWLLCHNREDSLRHLASHPLFSNFIKLDMLKIKPQSWQLNKR